MEEESGELLSSITINGKPIEKCELALECNKSLYRLYVDRDLSNGGSFEAIAVEFISSYCKPLWSGSIWDEEEVRVDQIFTSRASFDGVRHFDSGYINYPNIQGLIDIFTKLREIELEVCRDCDTY